MSDQGNPCKDRKEPHATRFKDHLLSLLPEFYISHKVTVADKLAKNTNFKATRQKP